MSQLSILEETYQNIKLCVMNKKITISDLIIITTKAMEFVNKLKIQGFEKKQIVIDVIQKIINESDLDEQTKIACNLFVQITLPIMIDTIIAAANQKLKLSRSEKEDSPNSCGCIG